MANERAEAARFKIFRSADSFNIRIRDKPVSAWEKDAEKARAAQQRWATEQPSVRRLPERA